MYEKQLFLLICQLSLIFIICFIHISYNPQINNSLKFSLFLVPYLFLKVWLNISRDKQETKSEKGDIEKYNVECYQRGPIV